MNVLSSGKYYNLIEHAERIAAHISCFPRFLTAEKRIGSFTMVVFCLIIVRIFCDSFFETLSHFVITICRFKSLYTSHSTNWESASVIPRLTSKSTTTS